MSLDAFALALAAAILHAVWNLLVAGSEDSRATTAVMLLIGTAVLTPLAVATWDLGWQAVPYAVASAVLELVYFALLAVAYSRSELSLVYPIARGLAPVVVLVVSVVFLGVSGSAMTAAGIVLVTCGVLLVGGARRRADPRGVAFAMAISVCIAGYTLLDKEGLRYAGAIAYLELVSLLYVPFFVIVVLLRRRPFDLRRAFGLRVCVAGVCTVAAYGLVLAALERAPAAPVAAVRESSVLIATILAAVFLRERVTALRLVGATSIVVGVAVVSLA